MSTLFFILGWLRLGWCLLSEIPKIKVIVARQGYTPERLELCEIQGILMLILSYVIAESQK